nr:uncharacterized protein LOC128705507 isoform X2 [Cherax quadricarinatus]
MKVFMCVLVTVALTVLSVDASPQLSNVGATSPCPDPGPLTAMTALTEELCVHADKTKCEANMENCMNQLKPVKNPNQHYNRTLWKEKMLQNTTTCANQLGYSFTPPASTGSSTNKGNSDSSSNSASHEHCPHHFSFEKYLTKLGFSQDELVPMMQCLMTMKLTLDKYRTCINQ